MTLSFASEISPAEWVQHEIGEFGSGVRGLLPRRFDHYVRILHPAFAEDLRQVRWAEVAEWSGREIHPTAQFKHVSRPRPGARLGPKPWSYEPNEGDPPQEVLSPLLQILARHTRTPDRCWFCLWEGWGQLSEGSIATAIGLPPGSDETPEQAIERLGIWTGTAIPPDVMALPKVELPGRSYFLLSGPLSSIVNEEMVAGSSDEGHPGVEFVSQAPSLFWPEDRGWCVASEIDFDSTYLAGSAELISEVLEEPSLETWPAKREDRVGWAADEINAE